MAHRSHPDSLTAVLEAPQAPEPRTPRAKFLTNLGLGARIRAAARVDAVLTSRGITNGQLSLWWGVTEPKVREIRLGVAPLQTERLAALPEALRHAVLDALKAP